MYINWTKYYIDFILFYLHYYHNDYLSRHPRNQKE